VKTLLLIIVVLFVAVLATLFAVDDPGYVLIARSPWSIEMPLTLFAPLLIAAFIVLHLLWQLIRAILGLSSDVSRWRAQRHAQKARRTQIRGLIRLAEANWPKAQAELTSALQHVDSPLINYLGAACASQAMGDTEKRDEYISLAQKTSPQDNLAIAMTQAHLYSWTEQHEQALATLSELRVQAPKHKHVLRLLLKTYLALHDWTSLAALIPELRKEKVLSAEALAQLELQVNRELLMLSLPAGSPEVLKRAWNEIPKALRQQPGLIAIYANHLIKQNQMNEAEALLRAAINRNWNDELVELYGRARSDNPSAQLQTAESWLPSRPEDPTLLLTLGRLSLQNELWGKARSYLESSLKRRPSGPTYRELGTLMQRLGESEKALDYYRGGLETLISEVPIGAATVSRLLPRRQRATG
jgi:HemY protein